jgi:hypothetical protein
VTTAYEREQAWWDSQVKQVEIMAEAWMKVAAVYEQAWRDEQGKTTSRLATILNLEK